MAQIGGLTVDLAQAKVMEANANAAAAPATHGLPKAVQ